MRTWSLLLVGAAALAGSSGAIAAPINGSAIKAAADQVGVGETVHCRPWRHWHPWGWGRGCRGATIYYDDGPSYRFGFRHGHRFGHRDFDVRTRSGTAFRGETFRGGQRGEFRGGTTFRSGAPAGDVSPRAATGGGFRSGGQAGGGATVSGGGGRSMGGGQMQSAPTGGGGAARGGGGQGGGGQGGGGFGGKGGGDHKQ